MIERSSIFKDKEANREINLEELVKNKDYSEEVKTGRYYEYIFNKFFADFSKERYSKYTDRKDLMEFVAAKTGSVKHLVSTVNGTPLKVHHFGEVIEVPYRDYVVRARLLFDPTIMPEGTTSSLLVSDYMKALRELNSPNELEIAYL